MQETAPGAEGEQVRTIEMTKSNQVLIENVQEVINYTAAKITQPDELANCVFWQCHCIQRYVPNNLEYPYFLKYGPYNIPFSMYSQGRFKVQKIARLFRNLGAFGELH